MARMNTGGKSVRYDVAVSPALNAQVERYMKRHQIDRVSEVVRIALAQLVGQPELGEGMHAGRPKADG